MIVTVTKTYEGMSASFNIDGSRELTDSYLVITNDAKMSMSDILIEAQRHKPGIPIGRSSHPDDPYSVVTGFNVSSEGSGGAFAWLVDVSYGRLETVAANGNVVTFDPLKQLPRYKWTEGTERVAVELDARKRAVVNSAGQKFDPPVEIDSKYKVLWFQRNERKDKFEQSRIYENAINQSMFRVLGHSIPKYEAVVLGIESEFAIGHAGEPDGIIKKYFVNTYRIAVKVGGWDMAPLDIGTQERFIGTLRDMVDDDGVKYQSPQLLDGNGLRLKPDDNGNMIPVFLDAFQIYTNRIDFGPLDLPKELL